MDPRLSRVAISYRRLMRFIEAAPDAVERVIDVVGTEKVPAAVRAHRVEDILRAQGVVDAADTRSLGDLLPDSIRSCGPEALVLVTLSHTGEFTEERRPDMYTAAYLDGKADPPAGPDLVDCLVDYGGPILADQLLLTAGRAMRQIVNANLARQLRETLERIARDADVTPRALIPIYGPTSGEQRRVWGILGTLRDARWHAEVLTGVHGDRTISVDLDGNIHVQR